MGLTFLLLPISLRQRNKFHCVINIDHTEIILVDTPGVHVNKKEINKRMNEQAKEGVQDRHYLLLIDLSKEIFKQFIEFRHYENRFKPHMGCFYED